jgi:outer membrane protein assembly factor BamB
MCFVKPASLVAMLSIVQAAPAQDWPQWLGPNRNAQVTGFVAPAAWPKTLKQDWKVSVGNGVATPALVGSKLFVFTRQGGNEIVRCLDASTGKETWLDTYKVAGADGPAQGFEGPRCTPTVADGKVVTFGVRGHLNCYDAASGKALWRKNDFPDAYPDFYTSASPIIVNGLCIAQVGKRDDGGIVAYELTTGAEKWKWTDDGPAYASPVLMTIDDKKYVIAMNETAMVALDAADGKLAWEAPWKAGRGPGSYNSSTPVIDGTTLVYGGGMRGTRCVKLEKKGDVIAGKEIWSTTDKAVQFNTPVAKDGHLFGITQSNELFCANIDDGKITWSQAIGGTQPASGPGGGKAGGPPSKGGDVPTGKAGDDSKSKGDNPKGKGGDGPQGKGGMGKGGGRGGRGGGYGSIVDAGTVLMALTPTSELVVYQPNVNAYKEIARFKVAETPTYAYPVIAGKRIFVKDADHLTLWTIE